MQVFIAHSQPDEAVAAGLKAFLDQRGLPSTIESGERGYRYLQPSDVVVVLWSKASVFSPYRLQLERRMLDAWADQRLVLVKLDHNFLPVGMRDLPAIDATFDKQRDMVAWPQVERTAKAAINAALLAREQVQTAPGGGGGEGVLVGGVAGRAEDAFGPIGAADDERSRTRMAPQRSTAPPADTRKQAQPSPARKAGRRAGAFLTMTLIVGALLFLGAAGVAALQASGEATPLWFGLAGGLGLAGLVLLTQAIRATSRRSEGAKKGAMSKTSAAPPAPPPAAAEAAPESVAEEAAPTAVFISYSHADNDAVTRVVTVVEAQGRKVWIDKSGIQTGDGWAGEIVRAIKAAHGVLVMCSNKAFESDHVKREVYLADRYKKPMAPVFLEQAQPPEDFEYFFANVQWLELWKLPEAEREVAIGRALKAV